jgi:hypothetical protein
MELPLHTHSFEEHEVHRGPPLLVLAIVVTVLFLGSLALTAALTHGEHIPSPFDPSVSTAGFFFDHGAAVRLCAFLQLGAAIVLGNFAATLASRLRFLGVRVAGVNIALFGGIAAATLGLLSALLQWVLTQVDPVGNRDLIHALHLGLFATGGVGFIAAAGLLMLGGSLSGGLSRLLPRWVMWLGLALGVLAEVSTLTLLSSSLAVLLPIVRLGSLVWMIGVGATLPRSRAEAARREQPVMPRVVQPVTPLRSS